MTQNGNIPPALNRKFCDGAIFCGNPSGKTAAKLNKCIEQLPAVWCFREFTSEVGPLDHVFYDNRMVGRIAANYLHSRGHRQVAAINSNTLHNAYRERVECFVERCRELGLEVEVFEYTPGENMVPDSSAYRKLSSEFLAGGIGWVTGTFFCSDNSMLGVSNELRCRLGVEALDLDMIGCNADDEILRFFPRQPATIDLKVDAIASSTVEQLLRRINGREDPACEIFIKPELVAAEE